MTDETQRPTTEEWLKTTFDNLRRERVQDAYVAGAYAGQAWRDFGANVAMAYFEGGRSWEAHRARLGDLVDDGIRASFFDGFTKAYWVDVTDQQRSGPYA